MHTLRQVLITLVAWRLNQGCRMLAKPKKAGREKPAIFEKENSFQFSKMWFKDNSY